MILNYRIRNNSNVSIKFLFLLLYKFRHPFVIFFTLNNYLVINIIRRLTWAFLKSIQFPALQMTSWTERNFYDNQNIVLHMYTDIFLRSILAHIALVTTSHAGILFFMCWWYTTVVKDFSFHLHISLHFGIKYDEQLLKNSFYFLENLYP